jgi:hypothetical protein
MTFPNEEITLTHHYMGRDPIKINIAECLRWMTDQAINNYDTDGKNQNIDATAQVKEAML